MPNDTNAWQIEAKFETRRQFEDESIDSYYDDLVEWATRMNRAKANTPACQPLNAHELDHRVKLKFIDGLHDAQVRMQMKATCLTSDMGRANSNTVRAWAVDTQAIFVTDATQYREEYRTCAEFGGTSKKGALPIGATRSAAPRERKVLFDERDNGSEQQQTRFHQAYANNVTMGPLPMSAPPTYNYNGFMQQQPTQQHPAGPTTFFQFPPQPGSQVHTYYANQVAAGEAQASRDAWPLHPTQPSQYQQHFVQQQGTAEAHRVEGQQQARAQTRPGTPRLCYNCEREGHFARNCPDKQRTRRYSGPSSRGHAERYSNTGERDRSLSRDRSTVQHGANATAKQHAQPRQYTETTSHDTFHVSIPSRHYASGTSDTKAKNPLDPEMLEVIANVELNGVGVKATFDTGSALTLIRESLWKRIARQGDVLKRTAFTVSSCAEGGVLDTKGSVDCNIRCHGFQQTIAVVVLADRSLKKDCLLGLNVVRNWPAMNAIFKKLSGVDGVEFGRAQASTSASARAYQINVMMVRAIARPTIQVESMAQKVFGTRENRTLDRHHCAACNENGHARPDCPYFKFNDSRGIWTFTKERAPGFISNNELWRVDEDRELGEEQQQELLTKHKSGAAGDVPMTSQGRESSSKAATTTIVYTNTVTLVDASEALEMEEVALDANDSDNLHELEYACGDIEINAIETGETRKLNEDATSIASQIRAELRKNFPQLFFDKEAPRRQVDAFEHAIELVDGARPFKIPARFAPFNLKEELREVVTRLLARGIIKHSSSCYASPVVLVRKKSGELRMCIDYRKLNDLTKRDNYPIPRIDELIAELSGAGMFTTLDLAEGYYQIPIRAVRALRVRSHAIRVDQRASDIPANNGSSTAEAHRRRPGARIPRRRSNQLAAEGRPQERRRRSVQGRRREQALSERGEMPVRHRGD